MVLLWEEGRFWVEEVVGVRQVLQEEKRRAMPAVVSLRSISRSCVHLHVVGQGIGNRTTVE